MIQVPTCDAHHGYKADTMHAAHVFFFRLQADLWVIYFAKLSCRKENV